MPPRRAVIDWMTPSGRLQAIEPELAEVESHVSALATAYNDPHNAPLLGHGEPLSHQDVLDHYQSMLQHGAHPFLLYCDGAFAGDGDLRQFHDDACEFAFLVAAVTNQGKGLGTRFATMIHAHAFGELERERVYASIVPTNLASRRVFDKLGYTIDASAAARGFADDPDDLTMVIDRASFTGRHAAALAEIQIAAR